MNLTTFSKDFRTVWLTGCLSLYLVSASATDSQTQIAIPNPSVPVAHKPVNFGQESASKNVHRVADWIISSNNNQQMPFIIIDKTEAKVFVFHANGQLRGAAAALLGISIGDDAAAGIGEQKLATIPTHQRTTPAGRFVASLSKNLHSEEILWVDYETSISLHRVHTTNLKEQRGQRLASATPADNRISFGCINVPVKFYTGVVSPTFTGTYGVVYVLPEVRSLQEVFGIADIEETYAESPAIETQQP
jgi:hypothetical protein